MSNKKIDLIDKTTKETISGILKELLTYDTTAPKDILEKINKLDDSKDPEKIIALLPKELQRNYNRILMTIKTHIGIGIHKYDTWLGMIQN